MLKSFPIFKKNGVHLAEKMTFEKNKDCLLLRFECFGHAKTFLICVKFEQVNFTINGKYSQKNYDNPKYYASFMIFQTYKNVVLKNVHSFGWLL
jgi:hypothetical protein